MRILQLTVSYPPPLTGGLPRQVHGLAHALATRHTVGVVAAGRDRRDGPVRVFGADPVPDMLPSRDMSYLARVNMGLVKAIHGAVKAGSWDIVHAHDWMVAPAAVLAHEMTDIPVVTSIHSDAGSQTVGSAEDRERRLDWEASLAGVSSCLMAVSTPVRDLLSGRYPGVNATYLPNGVDVDRFSTGNVERDAERVLFVGRLVPYKGCQDAIRSIALLRRDWPDIGLDVIGDGFYRPELEALVENLELGDAVVFHGWREGDDLADAYASAALVVIPSHEEAFGIVALEAMAAGIPVVASAIPAFASYIDHGRTGMLTTPHDPAVLARHIDHLLRDATLRSTLARKARREILPRHSWDAVRASVESAYQDVLRSGR